MRISRRAAGAAAGVTLALGAASFVAVPAANAAPAKASAATTHKLGTKSLAAVLGADKSGFDKNANDFDILTAAVGAVLKAKPKSAVGVLANGKVAVTAFIPTDNAFRHLVFSLTGKKYAKESDVFKVLASLGIPTVETFLLYHVVPGATLDSKIVVKSNNAVLKTAQGGTIKVRVLKRGIYLQDKDPNYRNPQVIAVDVNKGNRQIAHVIDHVLRPVDLPPVAKH